MSFFIMYFTKQKIAGRSIQTMLCCHISFVSTLCYNTFVQMIKMFQRCCCIHLFVTVMFDTTLSVSISGHLSECETSWMCECSWKKKLQVFPLITKHKCKTTHWSPCMYTDWAALWHSLLPLNTEMQRRESATLFTTSLESNRYRPQPGLFSTGVSNIGNRIRTESHTWGTKETCANTTHLSSTCKQFFTEYKSQTAMLMKSFLINHGDLACFSLMNKTQRIAERKTSSPNTQSSITSIWQKHKNHQEYLLANICEYRLLNNPI